MNEFTIERVKKEAEQESLCYFLDAYKTATGKALEILEVTERPDFICARQNGTRVGVELARVRRGHPNDILWDELIEKQNFMSQDDALEMIQTIANEKEDKRKDPDWKLSESGILVIELRDITLFEIQGYISEEVLPDLYEVGFEEVWIADFSELEAYDNIELFCVKPEDRRGYYPRGMQKPYG